MFRHFSRAAMYYVAGRLTRFADILNNGPQPEQWLAHSSGRVVKITRNGVSTLGRE